MSSVVQSTIDSIGLESPLSDEDLASIVSSARSHYSTGRESTGSGSTSTPASDSHRRRLLHTPGDEGDLDGADHESVGDTSVTSVLVREMDHYIERAGRVDGTDVRDLVLPAGFGAPRAASSPSGPVLGGDMAGMLLRTQIKELENHVIGSQVHREQGLLVQVRDLQRRLAEAEEHARVEKQTLELELDSARRRLQRAEDSLRTEKAGLVDLAVSSALYEELRAQPSAQLTLREFAQVRLHELTLPLREDLERTRRELEAAQAVLAHSSEGSEREVRARALEVRTLEGRLESARLTAEDDAATIARLRERLTATQARCEEMTGKVERFDAVDARRRELEALHDRDAQLLATQDAALADVRREREQLESQLRDATRQLELLTVDKTYLQRGLEEHQRDLRRVQEELTRSESHLRDALRQKEALQEQLSRAREEARSTMEEKLDAEIRRLQEQSARELEEVRVHSREVYEREARSLREARSEAQSELARVTSRLETVQRTHDAFVLSHQAATSESGVAVVEIRSQLKMKAFELERLGLAHEEQGNTLRQVRLEAEVLREKLEVVRGEYLALEARLHRDTAELEAKLLSEREKVEAYEALELELDSAVLEAGAAEAEVALEGRRRPRQTRRAFGVDDDDDEEEEEGSDDHADGEDEEGAGGFDDDEEDGGLVDGDDDAGSRHARRYPRRERLGGRPHSSSASASPYFSARRPQSSVLAALGAGVPTATRRRVRQSIQLAERLVRAQREIAHLKRELLATTKAVEREADRANRAERLVREAGKPQALIVDELRRADDEIRRARTENDALRQRLAAAARALEDSASAREALETDLKRVLARRNELTDLRRLVDEALLASATSTASRRVGRSEGDSDLRRDGDGDGDGGVGVADGTRMAVDGGAPLAAATVAGLGAGSFFAPTSPGAMALSGRSRRAGSASPMGSRDATMHAGVSGEERHGGSEDGQFGFLGTDSRPGSEVGTEADRDSEAFSQAPSRSSGAAFSEHRGDEDRHRGSQTSLSSPSRARAGERGAVDEVDPMIRSGGASPMSTRSGSLSPPRRPAGLDLGSDSNRVDDAAGARTTRRTRGAGVDTGGGEVTHLNLPRGGWVRTTTSFQSSSSAAAAALPGGAGTPGPRRVTPMHSPAAASFAASGVTASPGPSMVAFPSLVSGTAVAASAAGGRPRWYSRERVAQR